MMPPDLRKTSPDQHGEMLIVTREKKISIAAKRRNQFRHRRLAAIGSNRRQLFPGRRCHVGPFG
jgi:hypothetical protein